MLHLHNSLHWMIMLLVLLVQVASSSIHRCCLSLWEYSSYCFDQCWQEYCVTACTIQQFPASMVFLRWACSTAVCFTTAEMFGAGLVGWYPVGQYCVFYHAYLNACFGKKTWLWELVPWSTMTSNMTGNTTASSDVSTLDIICIALQSTLILPICFGNILVLVAIHRFPRLRVPTNVFIGSLALADLLVGIVTIPTFAVVHHAYMGLEAMKTPCVASYVLSHGPTGISMVTMFVIAVERHVAIHHPFYYARMFTRTKARIVALTVWIYVWVTLSLLAAFRNTWTSDMTDCNFSSTLSGTYILVLGLHMLLIFVITTVLYSLMAYTAWQHKKAIVKQASVSSTNALERNAKIAKMLAMVLGIFYLCWIPYFISMPFALMNEDEDPTWLHIWEQLAGIVVLANSFLNPIVYACKNQDFRCAFKALLFKTRCEQGRDIFATRSASPNRTTLSYVESGGNIDQRL